MSTITVHDKPVRRARCSFCGGRGDSLKAENVFSPLGLRYRIPESHTLCKQSVLSLSLDIDIDEQGEEGEMTQA